MKKYVIFLVVVLLLASIVSGCTNDNSDTSSSSQEEGMYKDGVYDVTTDKDYEGYYTKMKITIENGKISDVEWNIYDGKGRVFDQYYKNVFKGNEEYIQQSINDWKGSLAYEPMLIILQDIDKVDAISKATWSNLKFKEAADKILKDVKK